MQLDKSDDFSSSSQKNKIVLQPMPVVCGSIDVDGDGIDVHKDGHMHFHRTPTVYQALLFHLDHQ